MDALKTIGVSALLSGMLGTASLPAQAHHSFPAAYQVDQTVTLQGTVVRFLFRNPHSFVYLAAPDKNGKVVVWAVEWGGGGVLATANISSDTLRPGDKVIVTGNPARDAATHRLRMRAIVRPSDGWKWDSPFG